MKYIANLSATYGHHMLLLLLLNLFPSQSHVNPPPLSPKKPNHICIQMDTQIKTYTYFTEFILIVGVAIGLTPYYGIFDIYGLFKTVFTCLWVVVDVFEVVVDGC